MQPTRGWALVQEKGGGLQARTFGEVPAHNAETVLKRHEGRILLLALFSEVPNDPRSRESVGACAACFPQL
jgi:hypothetical protein